MGQRLGALGCVAVCAAVIGAPLGIAGTLAHAPVLGWASFACTMSAIGFVREF